MGLLGSCLHRFGVNRGRSGVRRRRRSALLVAVASAWLAVGAGAQEDAADSYRRILKRWADGAPNQAVLDLVALERRWARRLNALRRSQEAELSRLVGRDRLSLVAPARLHQLAFKVHATGSYRDLPAHSMTVNDRAVKLTVRHGKGIPEIRETAAVLLTSMAVVLRNHLHLEAAVLRLVRATELDPELAVAFEWAAATEEEQGHLASAAGLLRRLVELEPNNFPGRLRLAMIESKRGGRDATGMLEGIVGSDHRSWAWIFAVQELARDYARAGREEEAIDLLRRASAEYPQDQGLAIALAFFDRGRRGRSRVTLEALESFDVRESARVHYGKWPRQEAFGLRVQATLRRHLPHLAKALFQTDEERP